MGRGIILIYTVLLVAILAMPGLSAGNGYTGILIEKSQSLGMPEKDFSNGAAFFDYNLDGYDDIFVNNSSGVCRLYRSNGNGFTDVAVAAGVSAAYHNLGIFTGDLDGDGWPDLLTFTEDRQVGYTYMNTGFATFVDAAISEFSTVNGYEGYAAVAVDIDNDGDLDIFYGARLYRNDGTMHFTDMTAEAGLSNIRFVCRAVFGDIDNDGDMDLIVNRQDLAATRVFRNDGTGHFTEISSNSSLGYFPTGLGVSLGDVDNDGDLDMYLGAGYSDPNYLFLNDGSGYFVDATQAAGLTNHNYTRGTDFFDVDNDGDLDLVVANENRSSQLYINDGTGHFTDVTDVCGINDGKAKAGAAVVGDYDADGDLDIYINRTDNVGNSFYENQTNNGHFITVTPIGTISNRAGIGTKAYLYPAGQLGNAQALFAYRQMNISNGFSASDPGRIHFGTGAVPLFDLRVIFPSGVVVDRTGITPGTRLVVTESGQIPDFLSLVPSGLTVSLQLGDSSAVRSMIIKNSAGRPLAWTASVADTWCGLNKYSGTTDDTILVTFNPGDKQAGKYQSSITVTASGAINSPRTVPVVMNILSNQPCLALSTTSLNFTATENGSNPWPQAFTITNTGQGDLDWTLTTSSVSWLSVSATSGIAPSDVTVTCATAGLAPGRYTATITVTSPGAINSPAYLTVAFTIFPGQVPERDTVQIASASVQPGGQIVLPIYLHNHEELAALSIPLAFDPAVMSCDSVSFDSSRVSYLNVKEANINNTQGQVLVGAVVFLESYIPKGDGLVAKLYMTISPTAASQVATIDTSFIAPSGEFALYLPSSETVTPEFIHANIFIGLQMYGDADGDGRVNVGDCVYLINYVFKSQRPPIPVLAGDANIDNRVNVGDIVFTINYIFKNGPPPGYAKAKGSAGTVYYVLDKVASGDGSTLQLIVDADVALGGLQFDVLDPLNAMTISDPQAGDLVENMTIYQGNTGWSHRFGLLNMQGAGTIQTGQGVALRATYKGPDATKADAHFFDTKGNEIPAVYGERGKTDVLPTSFELLPNYPNPFNPATTIKYALAKSAKVELSIYNVLGQNVKVLVSENQKAGYHSVIWDGTDNLGSLVATGIYFYRIKAGEFVQSRKMALIK